MGTRLYVETYCRSLHHHNCRDERGKIRRVDLLVEDHSIVNGDPESLCGRYVDCDDTIPYLLELGIGVRLVEEKEKE